MRGALAACLVAACAVAPPAAHERGRLVVFVSVDQLRSADLLLFALELGPGGFAGLGRPAALRYVSVGTETAAGHATLATGAWADVHGVVGNSLWDGAREREAVDDPRCPVWGKASGRSAAALRVPTVGDALKMATLGRGRVVSVAGKDRSALLLAGASADLALFWDVDAARLVSTSCFAPGPPAWLPAPVIGGEWAPSRPLDVLRRYGFEEAPGAILSHGMGPRFPHPIANARAFRFAPASTDLLLSAARAAVDAVQLGSRGEPDLLLLGLSALDYAGHRFGPQSVERADVLLHMHDALGRLVRELRGRFGDRVSFALSSDHGVTPIAEQSRALRVPGGRLREEDLKADVDAAVAKRLGPAPGGWVSFMVWPSLAVRRVPGIDAAAAIRAAAEALRAHEGVARVVTAEEMAHEPPSSPFRHAFVPGRSGDLLFELLPGWSVPDSGDATEHRGHWNDDALVPLLVSAPGLALRRGSTLLATQVAPALAMMLGIPAPAAALDEAAVVER